MYRNFQGVFIEWALWDYSLQCNYQLCKSMCCRGEGKGTRLLPWDMERIIRAPLEKSPDISPEFIKLIKEGAFFEYDKGLRLLCHGNGDCIFFVPGKGCGINDYKPDYCQLFPVEINSEDKVFYLDLISYSECRFTQSEQLYLKKISPVLSRRIGVEWTQDLLEALDCKAFR